MVQDFAADKGVVAFVILSLGSKMSFLQSTESGGMEIICTENVNTKVVIQTKGLRSL